MNWLALDIGGANLKAADGLGFAVAHQFPLWQTPRLLAESLRSLIASAPGADHLALTMTGELADCFVSKAEGVQFIVNAFVSAADGRHSRVYLLNGNLVAPPIALKQPLLAAASNWHALGRFAGRYAPQGAALLVDIGSTTCDIIPLQNGQPITRGQTDCERLLSGELVYTGVERSPVCAMASSVPYRGGQCPLAQEVFATAWDVYLMLGDLPEEPLSVHTADRRPATRAAAQARLGRSICADRDSFNADDAMAMAQSITNSHVAKIAIAVGQVVGRLNAPPETIIISGQGEFLAWRLLERLNLTGRIVSLKDELGLQASRCATAHALAVLARGN